jgi:23S rRNA pseudouridine1911/1915/1917 synthase
MPIFRHAGPATRLDLAIAQSPLGISRREAKRLLDDARVAVDARIVGAASREVPTGAAISILTGVPEIPLIDLTSEIVAIDKPSGLPAQPTRERDRISAVEILGSQLKRSGEKPDLFVVHRIDSGTSGVLLFARNRVAAARLSALFAAHEMEKVYLALVAGQIEEEMLLGDPIARTGASRFEASEAGKFAETFLNPLRTSSGSTLVEIRISTGRTHQIRVHLSSAGFPIAGDLKYGGATAPRLMLHAWKLGHPSIGSWTADPPAELSPTSEGPGTRGQGPGEATPTSGNSGVV